MSRLNFLIGPSPVRRTLTYLNKGKLIFKPNVRIMTVSYNGRIETKHASVAKYSVGVKEFLYWHLGQVQHKNPNVQIDVVNDRYPTPFIRIWFDSGKDILIDVFGKSGQEILDHLIKTVGTKMTSEQIVEEEKDELHNPANFGLGYSKHCVCEIPGHVPCPKIIPLPKEMTGKWKFEHGFFDKKKPVKLP